MEFAGNQESKVIRVPQLKRGKEDVAVSERVSTFHSHSFVLQGLACQYGSPPHFPLPVFLFSNSWSF